MKTKGQEQCREDLDYHNKAWTEPLERSGKNIALWFPHLCGDWMPSPPGAWIQATWEECNFN